MKNILGSLNITTLCKVTLQLFDERFIVFCLTHKAIILFSLAFWPDHNLATSGQDLEIFCAKLCEKAIWNKETSLNHYGFSHVISTIALLLLMISGHHWPRSLSDDESPRFVLRQPSVPPANLGLRPLGPAPLPSQRSRGPRAVSGLAAAPQPGPDRAPVLPFPLISANDSHAAPRHAPARQQARSRGSLSQPIIRFNYLFDQFLII